MNVIHKELPYYKHGSREYLRIWQRIQRNKKKHGFKIHNIPSRFLDMQRGNKFCLNCKKIKHISEFYWKPDKHMFINNCKKCRNKLEALNRNYRKYKSPNREEWKKNRRISVLKKVQNYINCVRCGCDDYRLLEINHKNGGGKKELKNFQKYGRSIEEVIRRGWRETDDLELLCRPCNQIHYLERKYGSLPIEVKWNG